MADLNAVMAEHYGNVGWREGANNDNRWGAEQGVGNHYAYCDSATSMVAHHHGVNWWPDCTFHDKGSAYTVAHVNVARAHGKYIEDHASKGQPAPLKVGQPVFFDWNGTSGVDHVETVAELPQGPNGNQYVTIGYNCGSPGGCWKVLRDRKYLHGTIVMDEYYATVPTPQPTPAPAPAPKPVPQPGETQADRVKSLQRLVGTTADGAFGPNTDAAINRNLISWSGGPHRKSEAGNHNSGLVRLLQHQGNRRFNNHMVEDGQVGPATNHLIVVQLGQGDGIAGPGAWREAVR